ncbi:MAG: restriction endonuclease subunit S [Bacteroidetes bacterium]|nr:restriction endonuclease subunit S [Bacteroidota bacterium]MBU1113788.1 restriction endonuclease subunit S [Bacteroidota bacterium]MBU1798284.1 restriction endonuclease subunit S [Bacteroidota bacterium]
MKNYRRLGNFIQLVDERNKGLKVKQLLGLSISKQFIPSVANIIGTDMENYKIIRKNQFACSTMQVRRDKKMPLALLREVDEAIISQAYPIFEVKDEKELLPQYLMMWFTRSEFDREACFHAVGGVRGSLEWEDFENLQLPIPHPDKQREIVKEYNVIQNRIALNKQLIQKLEETAQAIYKQWFVEFEFPDENGKPYKSSGGEMVDGELGAVPNNWKYDKIGSYVKLSQGLVVNATTNHLIKSTGIPLLRITDLINDTKEIFIDESVTKKNIAKKEDIIITRTGQVGLVFRNKEGVVYNNCFKIAPIENLVHKEYLYWFLRQLNTFNSMVELASGSSAQFDLTHTAFNTLSFIIPPIEIQNSFSRKVKPIGVHLDLVFNENKILNKLKNILLSKLATVEN